MWNDLALKIDWPVSASEAILSPKGPGRPAPERNWLRFLNPSVEILVLGGAGQVGTELGRQTWPAGVTVHAPRRRELDLMDEASLERLLGARRWGCVINAAAFTAVDRAETEVATAWRANALAPAILAALTSKTETPVVHLSTDYVFDGQKDRPYEPMDAVRSLNVYGASKEGGEQAVRTANRHHVILRTAWLVSAHRVNFLKTMLRLSQERDVLRVVGDQHGCPTSAADLAHALRVISLRLAERKGPWGTYHFVNSGQATWYDLAREVMDCAGRHGMRTVPVEPLATADFPTTARRPANSVLDAGSLTQDYGIRPRPWQEAIAEIFADLHAATALNPGRDPKQDSDRKA